MEREKGHNGEGFHRPVGSENIRKHSDFVHWPIVMDTERSEYPDKEDGDGKDYSAEPRKWMEEETLNSQTAVDEAKTRSATRNTTSSTRRSAGTGRSHGIGFTCASKE